ncbi:TOB3 (member of AAA-ATPase family) [Fusarium pseudocircinatum]|uniref:TOB3 (Member of AAA-ATPase family) n=1 Tax=Fusarium pseudocircinatum TaxID=56676 RepID=A0A8H5PA32_9HYPO|nr:TOB3 (member of AAA-ATPase family) [Fusarium pseudocircinatum]
MASTVRSNPGATEESLDAPSPSLGPHSPIGIQRLRQNLASPYVNDRSDKWDFGLQYHRQLRQQEDLDAEHPPTEPAIIWNAKVYQSQGKLRGNDIGSHRPDLTYIDDRPIEFSISLSPTKLAAETDEKVSQSEAWMGPVIIIETFVEVDIDQDRLSRMNRVPEKVTSPCLDLLNPKHVSRRHLVVRSPFLIEVFSELVQYYPSFHQMLLDDSRGGELRIEEPFAVLFHHFDAIAAMANGSTSTADYDTKFGKTSRENHLKVAFDMIWYPLKPGTDIYVQLDGSTHSAVVMGVRRTDISWSDVWGTEGDGSRLVDLWRLETDGSRLHRDFISARINPYSGLRDVTSLQVCPMSIWDAYDSGERRRKVLCRAATLFKALQQGNLFVDYQGPIKEIAQYYTGKVVSIIEEGVQNLILIGASLNKSETTQTCSGAMTGFFSTTIGRSTLPKTVGTVANTINSDHPVHDSPDVVCTRVDSTVVQQLTEHQLLLLCPDVLAYGLRRKHWMLISLDYVQESRPSEESISNLIIAQDELKTIQALSNRQNSQTRHWSADFIEGKGSGQIILLHGPPGVGKTYTVEAISEWLHRPLLALTVADIGTVETLVEGELMKWFDLAEAWNAGLLVDEADIFLERRQNRDLARNGLVSAFLRRMEYFKGLLFLTTNRVGQIDDAFISRVHVAIGYQALDEETRRKIAPDAKKWVLDTAGETNLNGRDIRNALQTAITLAEFESEEDPEYDAALVTVVTKAHFQKVLEMCNRFRSYVTSIRREDEMKRAQGRGDRNDFGNEFESRMC